MQIFMINRQDPKPTSPNPILRGPLSALYIRVPLRDLSGPYKGSIRGHTGRFMGSYKWSYKSPNIIVTHL